MKKTNDERRWIIYMYTFPNGKRYIGKTCRTLKERQDGTNWRGYKNCPVLWKAIQKYGIENIKQDILFEDYMTDEYSDRLEMLCIALFKTNCARYQNPSYGYNCDDGGKGTPFHIVPEESKKKISQARKGRFAGKNNPMYGKKLSDEAKQKIGKIHRNKIIPDEVKKKMSLSHLGQVPVNTKPVCCIELNVIFDTILKAAEYFNLDSSSIVRCCKGKQTTSGGYHWMYVTDFSIQKVKDILMVKENINSLSVVCIETNNFYSNVAIASNDKHINEWSIKQCVNMKQKTAGGYHWRKAAEEEWLSHRSKWADEIISNLLSNKELMDKIEQYQSKYQLKETEVA